MKSEWQEGYEAGIHAATRRYTYRCDWCGRSWRFRIGYWFHWKFLGEVR
jgi:hypothetical protein